MSIQNQQAVQDGENTPKSDNTRFKALSDKELRSRIRERLEKITKTQETLAEAREDLLVKRERRTTSGKKVHEQRVETGNAEAVLMNNLRGFYNEYGGSLPQDVATAYERVTEARDKLGAMEEDYLQAERVLSGSEWTYMEKETDFYQFDLPEMFSDDHQDNSSASTQISPHEPSTSEQHSFMSIQTIDNEYRAALAELSSLREYFDVLRRKEGARLDESLLQHAEPSHPLHSAQSTRNSPNEGSYVVEKITIAQVRIQKLKQISLQCEKLAITRRNSAPTPADERSMAPTHTFSRARTESHLPLLAQQPSTQRRIREWLADYLDNNSMAKVQRLQGYHDDDQHFDDFVDEFTGNDFVVTRDTALHPSHAPSTTHETSQQPEPENSSSSLHKEFGEDRVANIPQPRITFDFDTNFNIGPDLPLPSTGEEGEVSEVTMIPSMLIDLVDPLQVAPVLPPKLPTPPGPPQVSLFYPASISESTTDLTLHIENTGAEQVEHLDQSNQRELLPMIQHDSGHHLQVASEHHNSNTRIVPLDTTKEAPSPRNKSALSDLQRDSIAITEDAPHNGFELPDRDLDKIHEIDSRSESREQKNDEVQVRSASPPIAVNEIRYMQHAGYRHMNDSTRDITSLSISQSPPDTSSVIPRRHLNSGTRLEPQYTSAEYTKKHLALGYSYMLPASPIQRSRNSSATWSHCPSEQTVDTQAAQEDFQRLHCPSHTHGDQ